MTDLENRIARRLRECECAEQDNRTFNEKYGKNGPASDNESLDMPEYLKKRLDAQGRKLGLTEQGKKAMLGALHLKEDDENENEHSHESDDGHERGGHESDDEHEHEHGDHDDEHEHDNDGYEHEHEHEHEHENKPEEFGGVNAEQFAKACEEFMDYEESLHDSGMSVNDILDKLDEDFQDLPAVAELASAWISGLDGKTFEHDDNGAWHAERHMHRDNL